jgi:hypothetical protein
VARPAPWHGVTGRPRPLSKFATDATPSQRSAAAAGVASRSVCSASDSLTTQRHADDHRPRRHDGSSCSRHRSLNAPSQPHTAGYRSLDSRLARARTQPGAARRRARHRHRSPSASACPRSSSPSRERASGDVQPVRPQILVHANDVRDPHWSHPHHEPDQRLDKAAASRVDTPGADLIHSALRSIPRHRRHAEAQASGELAAAQVVRQHGQQLQSYPALPTNPATARPLGVDTTQLDQHNLFAITQPAQVPAQLRPDPVACPRHCTSRLHHAPQALVSPAMVAARHWREVRAGWLIQSLSPLRPLRDHAARTRAANLGLAIETPATRRPTSADSACYSPSGMRRHPRRHRHRPSLLRTRQPEHQPDSSAVGAPSRGNARDSPRRPPPYLATLGTMLGITGAYLTLILRLQRPP